MSCHTSTSSSMVNVTFSPTGPTHDHLELVLHGLCFLIASCIMISLLENGLCSFKVRPCSKLIALYSFTAFMAFTCLACVQSRSSLAADLASLFIQAWLLSCQDFSSSDYALPYAVCRLGLCPVKVEPCSGLGLVCLGLAVLNQGRALQRVAWLCLRIQLTH